MWRQIWNQLPIRGKISAARLAAAFQDVPCDCSGGEFVPIGDLPSEFIDSSVQSSNPVIRCSSGDDNLGTLSKSLNNRKRAKETFALITFRSNKAEALFSSPCYQEISLELREASTSPRNIVAEKRQPTLRFFNLQSFRNGEDRIAACDRFTPPPLVITLIFFFTISEESPQITALRPSHIRGLGPSSLFLQDGHRHFREVIHHHYNRQAHLSPGRWEPSEDLPKNPCPLAMRIDCFMNCPLNRQRENSSASCSCSSKMSL